MSSYLVHCSKEFYDNENFFTTYAGYLPAPKGDTPEDTKRKRKKRIEDFNFKKDDTLYVYSAVYNNTSSSYGLYLFGKAKWIGDDKIYKRCDKDCYKVEWIIQNKCWTHEKHYGLNWETRQVTDKSSPSLYLLEQLLSDKTSQIETIRQETFSKNTILYGPPGTGKTRKAKLMASAITGIEISEVENEIEKTDGRIKLIQFHPSYSYFDFIEGIEVGEKGFSLKDKILKEFAEKADDALKEAADSSSIQKNNNYVLIIDEINRANIADVFGELLYALEYRGKSIVTSAGESLTISDNLYIIGTMNTADISIAGIDYAVRRRFTFEKTLSQLPDGEFTVSSFRDRTKEEYQVLDDILISDNETYKISDWTHDEDDNISNYKVDDKIFVSNLYNRVRIDIEKSVAKGINAEDIMPGVSYFLVNKKDDDSIDDDHLKYKIKYEIIPLLTEYAKNGLFSKRCKLYDDKSLCELVMQFKYKERIEKWLEYSRENTES